MFIPFAIDDEHYVANRQESAPVVYGIIMLCVAVHLLLYVHLSAAARLDLFYRFGVVKFQFRPWTFVTCTFLHGGWLHLLGNMYFLWIYGRNVERFLGSIQFLLLYIAGAFISVGFHLLTVSHFFVDQPVIGASGAISALLGAFFVFWPMAKLRCLFFTFISFRPIIVEAPAFIIIGLWFGAQLLYSLQLLIVVENVAFWAHVAGFVAGAGLGTGLRKLQERRLQDQEEEMHKPLFTAWAAYMAGATEQAAAACLQLNDAAILDAEGYCALIRGLTESSINPGRNSQALLLRAFYQARDYRRHALMLTVYLQIVATFAAEDIPASVHRSAGAAALMLRQYEFALQTFRAAVNLGYDEHLEVLLQDIRRAQRQPRTDSGA